MIEQLEVGDIILLKKEYWDNPEQPVTGIVTRIKGDPSDPFISFMENGAKSATLKEEIQAIYKLRCTLDYGIPNEVESGSPNTITHDGSIYTEDEFFHPND